MAHEKAPAPAEHDKSPETRHGKVEKHEHHNDSAETAKEAKQQSQDLEAIRSSIEKEAAESSDKRHETGTEGDKAPSPLVLDRTVKNKAYKKELHRIQSHLPKAQRTFSKFIHAPSVEAVSNVGGKTVARPSGLLGGGIVALLGSLVFVIVSRHYGFSYNFFVFIALLVGGFFVGLIIELLVRSLSKARS